MPSTFPPLRATFLMLFAMFAALGCSEERPPVSRVQANSLAKSFFVGELSTHDDDPEFYSQVTVVDVMYGANSDGIISSADSQKMTRVRWEITEKLLFARLTYELIADTDKKGLRPTPDGQIVAAFGIEKHFDIQNDYNPSTGEQLNVIIENDTDRAWYEREYFRVDWSKNLVTDAYSLDTLSQLGIFYAVEWEPIAYYVGDPSHPDAPVFSPEDGYFDVTTKALAKPGIVEDPYWGNFPACWLIGAFPEQSCNPTEVKLRASFFKVKETDYEPVDWTGDRMDIVGLFTQDRFGFETGYGVVDDKWHRFAARWNLHPRSHADVACNTLETTPPGAEPHRDVDQDGTEDECAAVGRGSRCDEYKQRCTIPLRDREIRTIPWHLSPDYPAELIEPTRETLAAWDAAVRVGVLAGRVAECRRTNESDCEASLGWPTPWSDDFVPPVGRASAAEVPHVFALCSNPVAEDDAPECGVPGTRARLGDLRYNFINNIVLPQTMSPWGIMMDAEDPLTGEKISGSVNLWGTRSDHAAAQLADLLMLLEGLLEPEEYVAGENVTRWVEELRKGGAAKRAGKAMTSEELERHRTAFDPSALASVLANVPAGKPGEHPELAKKRRFDALTDLGRLGPGNAVLSERLQRLAGSSIEARLVTPEMAQLAGFDPTAPVGVDGLGKASPFGLHHPALRKAMERRGRLHRAEQGSCRLDQKATEPDNLLGMLVVAKQLFGTPDPNDSNAVLAWRRDIYEWARKEYTKGVLAHELGHSMGLRHNFAASFDSLNYDAAYWQLRTRNGTVTEACPEGTEDGTACIGPRWRDPITDEELENNIGMYATTSVMDYPGDTSQDARLLGKYDRAAMRFVYGGVVDVWADPDVSVKGKGAGKAKAYKLTAFGTNPGLTGVYYFPPVNPGQDYQFIHYSKYAEEFGLLSACEASDAPGAILGQQCKEQPLDVVDYRDMADFADDPDYAQFSWARIPRTVDPQGRVRRGYMFQSDEYADAGNVTTFTDDAGADAYEIVRFLESQYELRYVLDSFRRNRTSFNSDDVVWRIQARYFDPIVSIAKTFAFGALLSGDPTAPADDLLEDGNFGPLALASSTAFDMFSRVMTRPEPGYYCSSEDCYFVPQPYGVEGTVYGADSSALPEIYGYNFHLPLGQGRYVHNEFDYGQGYWWGDYQMQVGAYYDKVWATYYLGEAFDYFISNSREDFIDGRYKNVNFATIYPEQTRRLYNALLTGDYDSYAPRVVGLKEIDLTPPDFEVLYPTWTDPSGLGVFPKDAQLVDPSWGWNERIYAMVWGAMFFPTNWSYDWVNEARITMMENETPDWPEDEIVAFFDPSSGLTYRARSTGTEALGGRLREKAAGARMLEWANILLAQAYEVERDADGAPILGSNKQPVLILDADGKPVLDATHPGALGVMKSYVDQIGMFRQIVAAFEQPTEELPQP